MTLKERQNREEERIRKDLHVLKSEKITLSHKITVIESEIRKKKGALKVLKSNPEGYFIF